MKKLIFLFALVLSAGLPSYAQTPGTPTPGPGNTAGLLYASNFGLWQVPQGNTGQYSWSSPSQCTVTANSIPLNPVFKVGTPVYIKDANPTNSEIVTPSAVNVSGAGCSITVSPTHPHTSFNLSTGTAGLQEAINYAHGLVYQVILTPDWTRLGGTTGMITAAVGSSNVSIIDERTSCFVSYLWSGSAYVGQPSVCAATVGVTEIIPGTNVTCSTNVAGSCTGNVTVNASASSSTVNVNGTPVTNPNFNSASPSPDAGYTAAPFKVSGSDVIAQVPTGVGSPLTTKGDLYTYSTTNTRLPVGTDGQALLADSAQTTGLKWGVPTSSGVQYPASNTDYVFYGDSKFTHSGVCDTGGWNQINITAWSITSNVATLTYSTNPALVPAAGSIYVLRGFSSGSFFNYGTTGLPVTILANGTGGGSGTFQFNFTHANASGTETTAIADCYYTIPGDDMRQPFFSQGGGTVNYDHLFNEAYPPSSGAEPPGSSTAMVNQYSTLVHPHSPAVTGHPAYLFLMITGDSFVQSGYSCPSIASEEANYLSLFTSAHTDGFTVVAMTYTTLDNGISGASCSNYNDLLTQLNAWMKQQGPQSTTTAPTCTSNCGKYWDNLIDVGDYVPDMSQLGFGNGVSDPANVHYSEIGAAYVSRIMNQALASKVGGMTTTPGVPSSFNTVAGGPSNGIGLSLAQTNRNGGTNPSQKIVLTATNPGLNARTLTLQLLGDGKTLSLLGNDANPAVQLQAILSTLTTAPSGSCTSASLGYIAWGRDGTSAYCNGSSWVSRGASGTVNSGTANQIAYYAGTGTAVSGTNALPNGTTGTTQTAGDNSTKIATTAYVDAAVVGGTRQWSCQPGLGDGLNAITAGTYLQSTCYNTTGGTVTLTGLSCFADNSGSSTMNAAGNTLGALLTGAVTCTTSFAAGTQSANVALTNGDYIKFTFVADGTSKQSTWVVTGTY